MVLSPVGMSGACVQTCGEWRCITESGKTDGFHSVVLGRHCARARGLHHKILLLTSQAQDQPIVTQSVCCFYLFVVFLLVKQMLWATEGS